MRKPQGVEMKSGNSDEDNTYVNLEDLEAEKMKENPKGPPPTKNTPNQVLLILVALLVLMFLTLVVITSLLFIKYTSISEEMSQLKNNVNTSTSELQRNVEDLTNKINTSTSELQRNVEDLTNKKIRTEPLCESGWLEFGRHCYFFSDFALNWTNAEKMCLNRESHLVIVNSEDEQKFLIKHYNEEYSWIGLTDMDTEGTFQWIDGTGLSYKFWRDGEPNDMGNNEDCVQLFFEAKWNDNHCGKKCSAICEKRLV